MSNDTTTVTTVPKVKNLYRSKKRLPTMHLTSTVTSNITVVDAATIVPPQESLLVV